MTYQAYETSEEASRPIELYTIGIGSDVYRLTSAEDEVLADGETYTPETISSTSVSVSQDRTEAIEVTIPAGSDIAGKYLSVPPGIVATISIARYQRDDTDDEVKVEFIGVVRSLKFTNDFQNAVLACYWHTARTSRPIPRFRCGAQCNYMLGDDDCGVNLNQVAFKHSNAVALVNGSIITVPGISGTYANDWFTGGYVAVPTLGDYRLILDHAGNDLTLLLPFHDDVTGVTVEVFAGCDHLIEGDCATKFDNVAEFGGCAWVPSKNPFVTGLMP